MYLSIDLTICVSICLFSWLSHHHLVTLFLSLCLKLTVYNYQPGHPSTSPSVCPPTPTVHASFGLSLCLPLRQEWEESAAEAAAGRWANVPRCTARGTPCATRPTFSLLLCQGLNNHIRIHRHTSHLYRLARGHSMDNDSHRCINSPQWILGRGGQRLWGETDRRPRYMLTTYVQCVTHRWGTLFWNKHLTCTYTSTHTAHTCWPR